MRRRHVQCLGGKKVEEVFSSMESLNPEGRGSRRLKQKGADNVISGTDDTLSFTVLGVGVRAAHAQVNAVSQEERAGAGVVELAAIVALNCLDGGAILSGHMNKEVSQSRERVRL